MKGDGSYAKGDSPLSAGDSPLSRRNRPLSLTKVCERNLEFKE